MDALYSVEEKSGKSEQSGGHETQDMGHETQAKAGWDVEDLKGDGVEVKYRIYEGLGAVKGYLGNPEGVWVSMYTASWGV